MSVTVLLLWHEAAEADWQNSKPYLADQTKENSDGSALFHIVERPSRRAEYANVWRG